MALERRIEADLALGRNAEVAGELEALIAKHPLRERLRAHRMLALYRAGRQAEALEEYQAARAALVDGLGIDPSPALQELERAILKQDPALAVEAPGAAPAVRPEATAENEAPAPERAILVVPEADAAFDSLLALAEPLARRPPREVILARLVESADELEDATRLVQERRDELLERRIPARAAAFTSGDLGADVVLLASEQPTDLVLLDAPPELLADGTVGGELAAILADAPCDVGLLVTRGPFVFETGKPVMVPFGGAEHDWSAIEIAAWISRSLDTSLRLLGTTGDPAAGRRDASRLLARASLMVQQVVGVATDPLLRAARGCSRHRSFGEGVLARSRSVGALAAGGVGGGEARSRAGLAPADIARATRVAPRWDRAAGEHDPLHVDAERPGRRVSVAGGLAATRRAHVPG